MSSAYHPLMDGQTEVANRVVEQYLQAFVHRKPSSWGRFLLWAEWSYNTSVLVKLRPYRQTTVAGTGQSKLSRRFYGPFKIVERMSPVAYKLELPEHSRIHPVFHCSLLKPFVGLADAVIAEKLPSEVVDNQPLTTPLAILGQKMVPTDQGPKRMVLVQWQGLHPDETSWEEWACL